VVLGFQGEARDAPSRQSSWGSGDTRWTYGGGGTLPSRNSSWGSYDMRPPMQYVNERGEKQQLPIQTQLDDLFGSSSSGMFPYDRDEIPWYPGTVKRTKQKLEEGTGAVKRMCSDAQQRSEPPASPVVGTQESPSPSPIRAGDSTPAVNVKIHGPRPYRSPSSDRLLPTTGFSFPPSDPHSSDHSGNIGIPFEAQNPVMIHYASSPTLCSHHRKGSESDDSMSTSPGSTEKMAVSQPNITFLDSAAVDDRLAEESISQRSSAIPRQTDFEREYCSTVVVPDSLPQTLCSLSASAPVTSSVSLVEGIEPLAPPSHSLPSVPSSCLVPRDPSAAVSCEMGSETSPCIVNTTQRASVKHQKTVLENLTNVAGRSISVDSSSDVTKDTNALPRSLEVVDSQKSVSGLVKNLKKEFEAKSINKTEKCGVTSTELSAGESELKRPTEGVKARSLPSSPVSSHPQCKSPGPASTVEDLSVKVLVGKYEVSKNGVGQSDSPPLGRRQRLSENETIPRRTLVSQPPIPLRKSSLEIQYIQNNANKHSSLLVRNLRNGSEGSNARPPIVPHVRSCLGPSPSVVVASVVAKAATKKQQQGKTHPLARLTINKPRHTNTVYNTM
jgi:protein phosphatase slingshot